MQRLHGNISQLDGNDSFDQTVNENRFWVDGYVGMLLYDYREVIDNIDKSNLTEDEKNEEKERAKKSRIESWIKKGWKLEDVNF